MADNDFPTLISATTAANAATNPIFAQLSDGTDTVNVTVANQLEVILSTALPAGGNNIGDVDVLSIIPGTGATNQGKAVDDAGGATDTGIALLALRDDVLTTLTPVDGDYVRLRVNSTGALHVTSTSLDNSAIAVDDSAFTIATDSVSVSGFLADETTPDSVDEGDIGAARMTLDRKILTRIVGSTDANRLEVAADGSIAVTDNGASLTVDNVTLSVVGGGVEATALRVTIANDSTGLLSVDDNGGSLTVDAVDLDIRDLTSASDSVEVLQATHGSLNANVTLQINDVDVSASVPVPISATAAANSETNPIFVQPVTTGVSASEVHDFDTATVAGGATSNHDYTVVNTTFLLKQVHFASSGALKIEIQTGPLASLVSVAVGFLPKTGGKNEVSFEGVPREVPVASTGTVRVIRTNREGSSNDVYSTIVGNDV